jgi:UPF0176 protein
MSNTASHNNGSEAYIVCALYKFVELSDFKAMRQPILQAMTNNNVKGTLLLAKEGINGTIAGPRQGVDALLSYLRSDPRLMDLDTKESFDDAIPFYRTKVKLKKEIVTLGVDWVDPRKTVGTYVAPSDWNEIINDPEVVLIDTRNDYEVKIGKFKNAINPQTASFREFPEYVKAHLDPARQKKVAMYCTGGIRCEKATAYLKELGFENVYHLKGGILKYLEEVPREQSDWEGECFVFDNRVTVDHNLAKGAYDQCHACRMPVSEKDKLSEHYVPGVSCPNCVDHSTERQIKRFETRQRQVELAKARGELHIGSAARVAMAKRQAEKKAKRTQYASKRVSN